MTKMSFNALNFNYLLLDFYKEMNINEKELAIILMINHLIEQGNEFVTNDLLLLKMNLSSKEIDLAMTNLYKKKFVEFIMDKDKPLTSIEPIKKIISKKFEKSLFSEQEMLSNNALEIDRQHIFDLFTEAFNRELNPIEYSHIDDWIKSGVSLEVIENSLKDAINSNKLQMSYIDVLVLKKNNEHLEF